MSGHCSNCGETGGCDCFQASPIEDDLVERLLVPHFMPDSDYMRSPESISEIVKLMRKEREEAAQSIRVMREALEAIEAKAQLASDALGNSGPKFKPTQTGLLILRNIARSALGASKEQSK